MPPTFVATAICIPKYWSNAPNTFVYESMCNKSWGRRLNYRIVLIGPNEPEYGIYYVYIPHFTEHHSTTDISQKPSLGVPV